MKKLLVFLLVFVFIISFTAAPKNVDAFIETPEPDPEVQEVWEWYGEGVSGEEISMDKITTTPQAWYQLKTNALKVDGATRICHGFDDGRYGWTGEIFRLVDGTWLKLPTTVGWVPTEEGHYMACAMAPAAGTYALFGYFDRSKAPVKEIKPKCYSYGANLNLGSNPPTFYNFQITFYDGPIAFIPVTYTIIDSNYPISGDQTATVMTDINGFAHFSTYQWQILDPITNGPINFTIHIETPYCDFDWNPFLS